MNPLNPISSSSISDLEIMIPPPDTKEDHSSPSVQAIGNIRKLYLESPDEADVEMRLPSERLLPERRFSVGGVSVRSCNSSPLRPQSPAQDQRCKSVTEFSKRSPLTPKQDGINASDVYQFSDSVVKPGMHVAEMAILSYNLADLVNLGHVIPEASSLPVSNIISRDDLEEGSSTPVTYRVIEATDGMKYLCNEQLLFSAGALQSIEHTRDEFVDDHGNTYFYPRNQPHFSVYEGDVIEIEGIEYQLIQGALGAYSIEDYPNYAGVLWRQMSVKKSEYDKSSCSEFDIQFESDSDSDSDDDDDDVFLVRADMLFSQEEEDKVLNNENLKDSLYGDENSLFTITDTATGRSFSIPQEFVDCIIEEKGEEKVVRNGALYSVIEEGGKYSVIGQNILSMIQERVLNCFVGKNPQKPLDLETGSADERKAFYDRIDRNSFIDAFIMSLLLRSGDGKCTILDEANYLFIPGEGGKLSITIIDYDEVMPLSHSASPEKQFPIKNALVGFPQCRDIVKKESEEGRYILRSLQNIVDKRAAIATLLQEFEEEVCLGKAHVAAFNSVIDGISTFIAEDAASFSLRSLWFFLLPEYAERWDRYINKDVVGEEALLKEEIYIANLIGSISEPMAAGTYR